MSETNSYKTITFSGLQAFAVARAMRARMDTLAAMVREARELGEAEAVEYLQIQWYMASEVLQLVGAAPLTGEKA